MKHHSIIVFFLALGLTGGAARAQDGGENSPLTLESFRIIDQNNIFDASRRGGVSHIQHHIPVVQDLVFLGVVGDRGKGAAFFSGEDTPLKTGDSIDGLKIIKMSLDSVELAGASNTFVLNDDGSRALRREDNGPWQLTDAPEETASAPATSGGDSSASSVSSSSSPAPGPVGESEIEKRLRLRREQDDK